jgi:hypothetical protein
MQNKPNLLDAQMNVNSYMKSKYEILDTWLSGKNKANSNPIKPNLGNAQMTEKKMISHSQKTNPIQSQFPKGQK